jgi:hypothetical protein
MVDEAPPLIQIALLDTTTFVWSEPQIDNPKVPNLSLHSATSIYSKFMLVAFGKFTLFF